MTEGAIALDRPVQPSASDTTSAQAGVTAAIDAHYAALVRRLTVVLRDEEAARDVAQETCLRAYRSWGDFDGRDARGWLYTIGLRLAINELSRRNRWSALFAGRRQRTQPMWVTARDVQLDDALRGLRAEHRAALWLNVVDGYNQAEIGAMLGVAPGTVASWVARAKTRLRKVLIDG